MEKGFRFPVRRLLKASTGRLFRTAEVDAEVKRRDGVDAPGNALEGRAGKKNGA